MSNEVVVCTWGEARDGAAPGAEELLTLGRRAALALRADLDWLQLGPAAAATSKLARAYGVAHLHQVDDSRLECFEEEIFVSAIAGLLKASAPRLLLLSQTAEARAVAARVAARRGWGVVMNAVDLEAEAQGALRVTASAYGGDTRVAYDLAGAPGYVVAVMANAVEPAPPESPGAEPEQQRLPSVELGDFGPGFRVVERTELPGSRLEDADIIVSGGRGLGSRESYALVEELAEALGGLAGASRPVVDEGWADSSRQVGLTGRITRPALYVAAGISGASQHMAGCSAAKTIVAINRDADAAIFRYARFGIVGDCEEILPALIEAARAK